MSQPSKTVEIPSPVEIETPVMPSSCYGHHPLTNHILQLIGQFTPAHPTLEIENQAFRLTCTQLTESGTCALTRTERCWEVGAIEEEIQFRLHIANRLLLLGDEPTAEEDNLSIFPEPYGTHYP